MISAGCDWYSPSKPTFRCGSGVFVVVSMYRGYLPSTRVSLREENLARMGAHAKSTFGGEDLFFAENGFSRLNVLVAAIRSPPALHSALWATLLDKGAVPHQHADEHRWRRRSTRTYRQDAEYQVCAAQSPTLLTVKLNRPWDAHGSLFGRPWALNGPPWAVPWAAHALPTKCLPCAIQPRTRHGIST